MSDKPPRSSPIDPRVIITVSGGVAECVQQPESVRVDILDYDAYETFYTCRLCGEIVPGMPKEEDPDLEIQESLRPHLEEHAAAIVSADLTMEQVRDQYEVFEP